MAKIQNGPLVSKIQNGPLVAKIQNRSLVAKIQNRSLVVKIQNRPLVAKIQSRPLVAKIPNGPLVAETQGRPLVGRIQNQPLMAKIQNRPLVSKIQNRSFVSKIGHWWPKSQIGHKILFLIARHPQMIGRRLYEIICFKETLLSFAKLFQFSRSPREGLNLFRFQMHHSTELNLCSIMLNTYSESTTLHCWRQNRRSLSRPSKGREQKLWLVHDYLW